tara:strand:+ start:14984 stop:16222 length:1239 start_codon:yes stop_codon:yes gene_type:complete
LSKSLNETMLNLKSLGPGLLYAAAAIGVSHLVQSTRAGADFGLQLIFAVIIANLVKYPIFKVGPAYTAVTGKSLLEGYQKSGKVVLPIFYLMTLLTMFSVQAAVTVVTAGLALNIFGLDLSAAQMTLVLLIISSVILLIGKYNILDNFIKLIVIILTITTVASVISAWFGTFPKPLPPISFDISNSTHLFFLVALVGWMPAPMDVPIWHSMWTLEKGKLEKLTPKETIRDFQIGFIGTAILACCFLALGHLVMYRSGISFAPQAARFAGQLIELYSRALGDWSKPLISIAAFTTMFSTTLTCLDAFPRILAEADRITFKKSKTYILWLITLTLGAYLLVELFLQSMRAFVDFATTLSFVVGPIYAYFNYKILTSSEIPKQFRGAKWELYLFKVGLIFLSFFALYYLLLKFFL